ncbi:DELTA-sagatoxin-Srs1a-like [Neosynchiropus ocellatus]
MPNTAEGLAAIQSSRRNVTIEISNHTDNYCLIEPRVHLESGDVHSPPSPSVRPHRIELCNFNKTSAQTSGAVGVLTYDVIYRHQSQISDRIAIMFSVPYSQTAYKNWFGLGIFTKDMECDHDLFDKMYNKDQVCFLRQESKGCHLTFAGDRLEMKATMNPMGRSIMKLEVWEKVRMGYH